MFCMHDTCLIIWGSDQEFHLYVSVKSYISHGTQVDSVMQQTKAGNMATDIYLSYFVGYFRTPCTLLYVPLGPRIPISHCILIKHFHQGGSRGLAQSRNMQIVFLLMSTRMYKDIYIYMYLVIWKNISDYYMRFLIIKNAYNNSFYK